MNHVVDVADMKVSAQKGDVLITYALGSCLGIVIHDPVACVGGMLHVMLPVSSVDPNRAAEKPHMFVNTGVPLLFHECYRLGACKERLVVKVAGGACALGNEADDCFQIGKRNLIMFRKLLWKNGVFLRAYDVGGRQCRTMTLEIGTGEVALKVNGEIRKL